MFMLWITSIFKWVLYSTALASILSIIILIFKLMFKEKLGARWHYAIWLIVILRLLIPYGAQSSLSIFNLFKFGSGNIAQIVYTVNYEPAKDVNNHNEQKLVVNNKKIIENITASKDKSTLPNNLYLQLISCLWLLGVILLGSYTIAMTINLKHKLKNEHICENEEVITLLLLCKNKFNLKSNIKIINTDLVKTPCIFGFIKPKLLLPIDIQNYVNKYDLEFIILHELAHVKRKDLIVSCISGALQILHWFNPIIWYSFYRMRNDKELACDALALSYVNCEDYINYGKTIIKLLESYKKTPEVYGMSCIINDKSQIKRRVTMISLFKKNSYKWSIIPIVTLVLMGGAMLTNAKKNPVLADNKNNQNIETNKILDDKIKTKENIITEYDIVGERFKGKPFKGKLLMIPNDKKIVVGFSKDIAKLNKTTSEIAKENKAICAINAGGFVSYPPSREFIPEGVTMHDGKVIFNDTNDSTRKSDIVAFTDGGKLIVGSYSLNELKKLNVSEAVNSVGPALIVNGKPTIKEGDGGFGIAPRTAIGQKKDGTILMLTIDGRSTESAGATLSDVQNVLLEHGAYNASNLDGGSSTSMYFNEKIINSPCGKLISNSSGEFIINKPGAGSEDRVVSTFMVLP